MENIELAADDIYNRDILRAMRWVTNSWKEVSNETITNCCSHCYINAAPASPVKAEEQRVVSFAEQLGPTNFIQISSLFNPSGEDECIESISLENQVEDICEQRLPPSEEP